jgi:hypothetical protein
MAYVRDSEKDRRWRFENRERLAARKRERYANDPDFRARCQKRSKAYSAANFAARVAYNREWNRKNPGRKAASHRKVTYGLSPEQYEDLFMSQGYKCLICGTDSPKSKKSPWHVDHCHTTGRVRGILCHRCNAGLGNFSDNIANLQAAIKYLRKNK